MRQLPRIFAAIAVMALMFNLTAEAGIRLEGSRGLADTWVINTQIQQTLKIDEGIVNLTSGTMRHLTKQGTNGQFLRVAALGLTPDRRFMMMQGRSPMLSFTADEFGRFSGQFISGIEREGWSEMRSGFDLTKSGPALKIVPLSAAESLTASMRTMPSKIGSYYDSTPLCGVANPGGIFRFGEASVMDEHDMEMFMVFAEGLEANGEYTIKANDIDVATVRADEFGALWLEALAEPNGDLMQLPPELLPVSVIAAVEIVAADGTIILAGDFTDPCDDDIPGPDDAGTITLCNEESPEIFGFFDWLMMDDGMQSASLWAMGLQPGAEIAIEIDGFVFATGVVNDWGELWLAFSTDPVQGEETLPPEVLPLNDIAEVILYSGADIVLSGTDDEPCDDWQPPGVVDMDTTPICTVDGENSDPRFFGEAGWVLYEDGSEEFWLWVEGLDANASLELVVDDNNLGVFTVDEWGSLWLYFGSEAGPGGDYLPLPEVIRPVSEIDIVALFNSGSAVRQGSFADPCDDVWEPPVPIDFGWTNLCGDAGSYSMGDVNWTLYESGDEELMISAWGLAPNEEIDIVIDGFALASFDVDPSGSLFVYFSTFDNGNSDMTLPDDIRPLSSIDIVELGVDGTLVLAGSFDDPCEFEEPPEPIAMDATQLCSDDDLSFGDVAWMEYENGTEELVISAFDLDNGEVLWLVIDGLAIGSYPADATGSFYLNFSSDPQYDDQLPLPAGVSPVSEIDIVELKDVDQDVVLGGSFSDPCTPAWPDVEFGITSLCDNDGLESGYAGWWIMTTDGVVVAEGIEIMAWQEAGQSGLPVEIDGLFVGTLENAWDWGMDLLLLTLATPGDDPVPPELSPVSDIDQIVVYDLDGNVAMTGSFSEPCVEYDIRDVLLPTVLGLEKPRTIEKLNF